MDGTDSSTRHYGIIYFIEHVESGKVYIGQTVQALNDRLTQHLRTSYCVRLHRALMKHGVKAFRVGVLDVGDSAEELDQRERFYIEFFRSTDPKYGYNLREGGSFGKHSKESRIKMSTAVRRALENPAYRKKLSDAQKGRVVSSEVIAKIAKSNTGKRHSQETRVHLAEFRKELWQDPVGRENMRAAQIEARKNIEYKETVSTKVKSLWSDPEYREKMLAARKATQEKGNEARRAAWADPVKKAARLAKSAETRERNKAKAEKTQ